MSRGVLLLAVLGVWLPAVDLTIVSHDEPLRPGLVWRCQVRVADAAPDAPIALTLRSGSTPLASSTAMVRDGLITFALIAPRQDSAEVQLAVACAGTVTERTVPTLTGLRRRVIAESERFAADPAAPPLTRLRLGQALALLLTNDHPTLADCQRATDLIGAVSRNAPAEGETAIVDPYDGSVQPLRVHAPSVPGAGIAVWLRTQPVSGPERWPATPPAVAAAAQAAGWWLVEPYPAGDPRWTGAARRRLDAALAQVRGQGAGNLPLAVIGADDPGLLTAWPSGPTVRAAIPPGDLAGWFATLASQPVLAGRSGRTSGLSAYVSGAFTVVVGTGEHRAAAEANARLATAFSAAWVAHAHSRVALHQDRETAVRPNPAATLICLGNPRSNAVLAPLANQLPVRWDDRSLTWTAADGTTTTWLRGERRAVGLTTTLVDGSQIIVLDGEWTFPAGQAPLGDIDADLAIGDGKGGWVVLR
jgi:hypothetical protein